MILKASQRSGASALAAHLLNDRDNDHVTVKELRGFVADDLRGALQEAHAISKATQCKQYLFSVSLNPPQDQTIGEDVFFDAVKRIEDKLGLTDQPRAIVFHEKESRRHAHIVWSRIDSDEMKAIPMSHFKTKLRDVARDLYLEHGWVLPDGLATYGNKNPLNFTLDEWQQAKRQKIDPREIKQAFQEAWKQSDSRNSLSAALEERGFYLAKGDRRGVVAVDIEGAVYSLSRWTGIKAKDVKDRINDPSTLPSVADVTAMLKSKINNQALSYITQVKERHAKSMKPLQLKRDAMVSFQRKERADLKVKQEARWIAETQERSDRINVGLRGMFDRLSGKAKVQRQLNEKEAMDCARRDQAQRDDLIVAQMKDRRGLQRRFTLLRDGQARDRRQLAKDVSRYLRREELNRSVSAERRNDHNISPHLAR